MNENILYVVLSDYVLEIVFILHYNEKYIPERCRINQL